METLSIALSLWKLELVSSEELIVWIDAHIQISETPDEVLVLLSLDGPDTCLKRPVYEFPIRPIALTFIEEFSLRVSALNLHAELEVHNFIKWAAVNCMGENLDDSIVRFCYQLDDFCTLEAQVAFLHHELPSLIPQSMSIANFFYARVPGLKLQNERTA